MKKQQDVLGVGLFDQISPRPLTANVENKIISYLRMNDLIKCARLNKNPWHIRMQEEIKRRKHCVTIYTWLGSRVSSEIRYENNQWLSQGRMGHSALKTYQGGSEGKGVYVSFYPGDCHQNNRHPSCKKSVSHFHQWNQERRSSAKKIDLYGMNIQAINKAFLLMHDSHLNSKKTWSARNNCSDVVLFLLEKGGFFNKLSEKRTFRTLTIVNTLITSSLASVAINTFGSLVYWQGQSIFPLEELVAKFVTQVRNFCGSMHYWFYQKIKNAYVYLLIKKQEYAFFRPFIHFLNFLQTKIRPVLLSEIDNPLQYTINIKYHDKFIAKTLLVGVTSFSSAYMFSYLYILLTYYKSTLPFSIKHKMAKKYALKAAMGCAGLTLMTGLTRKISNNYHVHLPPIFPGDVLSYFLHWPLIRRLIKYFPSLGLASVLAIPFALLVIPSSVSLIVDTTTTPNQVFQVSKAVAGKTKQKKIVQAKRVRRNTRQWINLLLSNKTLMSTGLLGLIFLFVVFFNRFMKKPTHHLSII